MLCRWHRAVGRARGPRLGASESSRRNSIVCRGRTRWARASPWIEEVGKAPGSPMCPFLRNNLPASVDDAVRWHSVELDGSAAELGLGSATAARVLDCAGSLAMLQRRFLRSGTQQDWARVLRGDRLRDDRREDIEAGRRATIARSRCASARDPAYRSDLRSRLARDDERPVAGCKSDHYGSSAQPVSSETAWLATMRSSGSHLRLHLAQAVSRSSERWITVDVAGALPGKLESLPAPGEGRNRVVDLHRQVGAANASPISGHHLPIPTL